MISLPANQIRALKSPLGISIIAHLIILITLALIVIKPERETIWHDFEWLSELAAELPSDTENPIEEGDTSENGAAAAATTTDESTPAFVTTPFPAPSTVVPSRQIIDAPGELADPSPSNTPKASSNLGSRGNVNRSGLIQGTGAGGYSSMLEGSGIRSNKEVMPSLKISDYGEVKLSFQVSRTGLVVASSINVIKSATNAQNQSAIEALKQWEFIVAPGNSADQIYSIRFIYNPGK